MLGYKEGSAEILDFLNQKESEEKLQEASEPKTIQPSHQVLRLLQESRSTLGLPEVDIPESLDWRQRGKVSPVKDQGECGSCWAFAGIGHLEALLAIHENREIDLSEQWALQCSSGGGCWGGTYYAVLGQPKWGIFMFNIDYRSLKTEAEYPYFANNNQFIKEEICLDTPQVRFSKKITALATYRNPSDEIMKRILVRQGPFAVALNANGFFNYLGGVLDCSFLNTTSTNHAVLVVGYDSDGNWIIKNSWGTSKGEGGYVTISKNANCNMESAAEIFF